MKYIIHGVLKKSYENTEICEITAVCQLCASILHDA